MIIITNGFPRSGKDTFMDFCIDWLKIENEVFTTVKHSSIDTVKNIATILGWNGVKGPVSRCMLSDLKDLYTKYFDGPLNEIKEISNSVDFVFTAMREPEEILKLETWCRNRYEPCVTVLVQSDRGEKNHISHSDSKVLEFSYDKIIHNNDTLYELSEQARNFVQELIDAVAIEHINKIIDADTKKRLAGSF
jgi:hypothetical protein